MSRVEWSPRGRAVTSTMGTVVVNEAESGRKIAVELFPGEDGAADTLRAHLYRATGVPPGNQILLCGGPPYKPLRSQLPPDLVTTATTATTNPTAAAVAATLSSLTTTTATTADPGDSSSNPSSSLSAAATAAAALTTTVHHSKDSLAAATKSGSSSTNTDPTARHSSSSSSSSSRKPQIFLFDWRTLAPERSLPTSPVITGMGGTDPGGEGVVPGGSLSASVGTVAAAAARAVEAEMAEFVGPAEVLLPSQPRAAPSPLPSAEGSVLLATIANYERGSMLALNRGQAYADSSARRLRGGEICFERMQTQIEALAAAVSNSLDHWEPLQQGYRALSEKLDEQALRHEGMLETFDGDLAKLANIPLHPSLAAASLKSGRRSTKHARPPQAALSTAATAAGPATSDSVVVGGGSSSASSHDSSAGGGGGSREDRLAGDRSYPAGGALAETHVASGVARGGSNAPGFGAIDSEGVGVGRGAGAVEVEGGDEGGATLLDCVPVEREQKLVESCRTSQSRFRQEAKAVAQHYADIKSGLEEQRKDPVTGNDMVQGLLERVRELCREQERRRGELEANYKESFTRATQENWTGDKEKQDAIQRMTELTVTQEKIVPLMKEIDLQVMDTVAEIAKAKATLTATLRRRLREVSKLQTDIGKIQKRQELVGMAWGQKEEQFEHLGKVKRMPAAYKAFLLEVLRRRRYHQEFETKVAEFCSSMEILRSSEIVAREAFRESHVANLPPVFIEMAPGLRNPPPVFASPPVTPLYPGELPDIRPEDIMTSEQKPDVSPTSPPSADAEVPAVGSTPFVVEDGTAAAAAQESLLSVQETGASPPPADKEASATSEGELTQEGEGEREKEREDNAQRAVGVSVTKLEAENALLARELVDARSRLEQLEREREESAPVAAAEAAAAATATPTKQVASLFAARVTAAAAVSGDPDIGSGCGSPSWQAPSAASDVAAAGAPRAGETSAAVTTTGGASLPAEAQAGGTPPSDAIVLSEPPLSPTKEEDPEAVEVERRRSFSDVGKRRSSSAARQNQLAAYRAGLSMLVRLADQLAAGAGSGAVAVSATAGGAGTSPARGGWEMSPPSAPKRALGAIPGSPVASRAIAAAACSSAEGTGDPLAIPADPAAATRAPGAVDPAGVGTAKPCRDGSGDEESNAAGATAPTQPQTNNENVTGPPPVTASAGVAETTRGTEVRAGEIRAVGDGDSSGGGGGGGGGCTGGLGEMTRIEEATGRGADGEGGGGVSEAVGREDRGGVSSREVTIAEREGMKEGENAGIEVQASETVASEGAPGSSLVSATVTDGRSAAPPERGVAEEGASAAAESNVDNAVDVYPASSAADIVSVTLSSESSNQVNDARLDDDSSATSKTATISSSDQDAASSARGTAASLAERISGSGVSSGGSSGVVGAAADAAGMAGGKMVSIRHRIGAGERGGSEAGGADIEKIRKAAEHVAAHLRQTHRRVEQLLPYEDLASVPRISMCSFGVQDIALFLPTMVGPPDNSGGTVFLAFHVNCPNRYLSEDSINTAKHGSGSYPAYVLGRIIMIEQHVATEEPNPYNVASKTVYYVLTAENVCL